MAFMMPVMKNDWDIYHSNRARKTSEGSGGSSSNGRTGRSRKVSETKSDGPSLPSSPGVGMGSPHRSAPTIRSVPSYCRSDSRQSRGSFQRPQSPKSTSPSPPKGAKASIDKFHTRLVDKLKRTLSRNSDSSERTT